MKVKVNDPFDGALLAPLFVDQEDLILACPTASFPYDPQEWKEKWFSGASDNTSLLFQIDDKTIGHVALVRKAEDLWVCFVILDKKHRGQGLAHAMMIEVEEFARLNYTHQELYLYVNKKNIKAQNLYQRLGYSFYAQMDDKIQMIKPL